MKRGLNNRRRIGVAKDRDRIKWMSIARNIFINHANVWSRFSFIVSQLRYIYINGIASRSGSSFSAGFMNNEQFTGYVRSLLSFDFFLFGFRRPISIPFSLIRCSSSYYPSIRHRKRIGIEKDERCTDR